MKNYFGLSLLFVFIIMQVWGAEVKLPAISESQSRMGNVKGSLIEGKLITTYDGTKQDQDWYAITLNQVSTVGWVVFTHGQNFPNGGWFDASQGKPQVQVQAVKDGPWTTVGELSDYPATTATDKKGIVKNARFACTIASPMTALSVRVIGCPACGDTPKQTFSSSAGLAVYTAPLADRLEALKSPMERLDTKLKIDEKNYTHILGPQPEDTNWLADMKKWRELKLAKIKSKNIFE